MKPTKTVIKSLSKTLDEIQYYPEEFRPESLDKILVNSGLKIIKVENKFFVQSLRGILYRIRCDNLLSKKQKKEAEVLQKVTFEAVFILAMRRDRKVFETTLRNLLEVSPERGTELMLLYLEETGYAVSAQVFKSFLLDSLFYEFIVDYGDSDQLCFFLNNSKYRLLEFPFIEKWDSEYSLDRIVSEIYHNRLELFVLDIVA